MKVGVLAIIVVVAVVSGKGGLLQGEDGIIVLRTQRSVGWDAGHGAGERRKKVEMILCNHVNHAPNGSCRKHGTMFLNVQRTATEASSMIQVVEDAGTKGEDLLANFLLNRRLHSLTLAYLA
jgi:hypothetical protein